MRDLIQAEGWISNRPPSPRCTRLEATEPVDQCCGIRMLSGRDRTKLPWCDPQARDLVDQIPLAGRSDDARVVAAHGQKVDHPTCGLEGLAEVDGGSAAESR